MCARVSICLTVDLKSRGNFGKGQVLKSAVPCFLCSVVCECIAVWILCVERNGLVFWPHISCVREIFREVDIVALSALMKKGFGSCPCLDSRPEPVGN